MYVWAGCIFNRNVLKNWGLVCARYMGQLIRARLLRLDMVAPVVTMPSEGVASETKAYWLGILNTWKSAIKRPNVSCLGHHENI